MFIHNSLRYIYKQHAICATLLFHPLFYGLECVRKIAYVCAHIHKILFFSFCSINFILFLSSDDGMYLKKKTMVKVVRYVISLPLFHSSVVSYFFFVRIWSCMCIDWRSHQWYFLNFVGTILILHLYRFLTPHKTFLLSFVGNAVSIGARSS